MNIQKCDGFKCQSVNPELRIYHPPHYAGECVQMCHDCFESACECGVFVGAPPWHKLTLLEPDRSPKIDILFSLASGLTRAQAAACVPVGPDAASGVAGGTEELQYLRDSHEAMRLALHSALNFVQAVEWAPTNEDERKCAVTVATTINAALGGRNSDLNP